MTQIILSEGESLNSGLARLRAECETKAIRVLSFHTALLEHERRKRGKAIRERIVRHKLATAWIGPHKCATNGCAKTIKKPDSEYCWSCQCSRKERNGLRTA